MQSNKTTNQNNPDNVILFLPYLNQKRLDTNDYIAFNDDDYDAEIIDDLIKVEVDCKKESYWSSFFKND